MRGCLLNTIQCILDGLCITEGVVLCVYGREGLCEYGIKYGVGPPSGGLAPYTDLCLDTAYTLAYTLSDTNRNTHILLKPKQNILT